MTKFPRWSDGDYAAEIFPRGGSSKDRFLISLEYQHAPVARLLVEYGVVTEVDTPSDHHARLLQTAVEFFKEKGFYPTYNLSDAAEKRFALLKR